MIIKVREQAGTDAGRKFDYQMAVALDYLLSEYDNDVIVLIETLEDFAVFRNFGTEAEEVDIYQVKTKNTGLYSKTSLWEDNVLGKIILTDFFFNSKAKSLNIVCNTHLKGTTTESFENFTFEDKLSDEELKKLKENVGDYLKKEPSFSNDISEYTGKLIYIKSALPFSEKQDRYSETLVGKTNNTIAQYLDDENHSINPQIVFNTLKFLIDKQRRNRFDADEVELDSAIERKGIRSGTVKTIIDQLSSSAQLTKKEILSHASVIYTAKEYLKIKEDYPQFVAYRSNLTDKAFVDAKKIVTEEYEKLTAIYDSLDEIARMVAKNCENKIPYYSLSIIQIITIVVIYS